MKAWLVVFLVSAAVLLVSLSMGEELSQDGKSILSKNHGWVVQRWAKFNPVVLVFKKNTADIASLRKIL